MTGTQENGQHDGENKSIPNVASGASEGSANYTAPLINNELINYVQFHMRQTAKDNIADVLKRFYCDEEVSIARDELIKAYDGQFVYKMKNRRDSKPTAASKGKCKYESIIEDILCVMYELDKNRIVTNFCATNLARLPKYDPKEVDPFSNLQLILDLKERVKNLEDGAGSINAKLISHAEDFKAKSRQIAEHDTTLSEHEIAISEHDICFKQLALANPNSFAYKNDGSSGNDKSESKKNNNNGAKNEDVSIIPSENIGDKGSVGSDAGTVGSGSDPVANGSDPVANGSNPVANGSDPVTNGTSSGNVTNGGSYAGAAAALPSRDQVPSFTPVLNQGVFNGPQGQPRFGQPATVPVNNNINNNNKNINNANNVYHGYPRNSNGMMRQWNHVNRNNGRRGSSSFQGN